jgi:2-dehydropantoate 2-reductase
MGIRYSVLGAGAMGSVFGARLHLAGYEVELLNRSPQHSLAIAEHGLRAHLDGRTHIVDIPACLVDQAASADVVILFTKSYDIENALSQLPESLREAKFLTLQNGLGNAARVASQVGISHTIEGVTMMPAEFIRAGEVASSDVAETWMYHGNGEESELVTAIADDFNSAGIVTQVSPDISRHIWQKACFNLSMNALCALTIGSPGLLREYSDGVTLAHEIADESMQIADAIGILVDAGKVHALIDFACVQHTWHKPSMLQDVELGRRTEIEALNGYIETVARERGLDAPLNRMLARLIRIRQGSTDFWRNEPASDES